MTTYQAAQKVRKYLIEKYAMQDEPEVNLPVIWKKDYNNGWEWAVDSVNVVLEGEYDWPFEITEDIYAGKLVLPGIFCEPATGYALNFYKD